MKITRSMLEDDGVMLKLARTPAQLREERAESVSRLAKDFGHIIDRGFTCDECSVAPKCSLAFDGYNTNGDCLASK